MQCLHYHETIEIGQKMQDNVDVSSKHKHHKHFRRIINSLEEKNKGERNNVCINNQSNNEEPPIGSSFNEVEEINKMIKVTSELVKQSLHPTMEYMGDTLLRARMEGVPAHVIGNMLQDIFN